MFAVLLYLLGPLLIAAWAWRRPSPGLRGILFLWVVGLALARIAAPALAALLARHAITGPSFLIDLLRWAGAVALAASLWSLCRLDRPRTRRHAWFERIFLLAILLAALTSKVTGLVVVMAIPFLWSFRWQHRLGAAGLLLVTLTALISVVLCGINITTGLPDPPEWFHPAARFASEVAVLCAVYAALVIPAAGSRIHLSIRSIGRRLVGSHLLASVIPFVLGAAFLLLASSLYLSTYRGTLGVRLLRAESERAITTIRSAVEQGQPPPAAPFGPAFTAQVVLWRDRAGAFHLEGAEPRFPADSLLSRPESSRETPLLWDGSSLWLRARATDLAAGGGIERIEALALVDSLFVARISEAIGQPLQIRPALSVVRSPGGVQIGDDEEAPHSDPVDGFVADFEAELDDDSDSTSTAEETVRIATPAIGPRNPSGWRPPGGATVSSLRWSGTEWSVHSVPLLSSSPLGETIVSLFDVTRENPLAYAVLIALGIIAVLILGTLAVTVGMVSQMSRSITRAVRGLTSGTRALEAGRLDHRITLEGNDELWGVAASFNQMSAGLQKIREMELEQQRYEEEMRVARGIQERLLPSAPPSLEHVELAGMSLPAREVGGDYFDYLLLDDGRIALAVADVSGKGTPAALLMSAFRASFRSQDLARLGAAESLARINRFIHARGDPGKLITAFIALLHPETGEVRYANAGHDAPLVLQPDGTTRELTGGGLILGMLPQIMYEEGVAVLDPGSLLAIYTDGVPEARSEDGGFYGPERLLEVMRAFRHEPCSRILQRLVASIEEFAGAGPQSDDITVILARRK